VNPPSEVTVLSDNESRPSLLPPLLEVLQSSSFVALRGTINDRGDSVLRGTEEEVGDGTVPDIEDRRFGWVSRDERVSAAKTLEIETEVVAGVTAGRLTLETRRGVEELSRSMGLRLGEELEE